MYRGSTVKKDCMFTLTDKIYENSVAVNQKGITIIAKLHVLNYLWIQQIYICWRCTNNSGARFLFPLYRRTIENKTGTTDIGQNAEYIPILLKYVCDSLTCM